MSGDLLDQSSITSIVARVKPDEIYNLAAQSFVPTSWDQPVLTGEFTALGVTRVLEAIRAVNSRDSLLSGVELGDVRQSPSTRRRTRRRRSIRARRTASPKSTAIGSRSTIASRTTSSLCSGILFNHEVQPPRERIRDAQDHRRRGAHQARPREASLRLGNLDAQRDWGFRRRLRARDVADAAATDARRLRDRDRRNAQRRAISCAAAFAAAGPGSYENATSCRSALLRPAEVDVARRRREQGAARCSAGSRRSRSRARRDDGAAPTSSACAAEPPCNDARPVTGAGGFVGRHLLALPVRDEGHGASARETASTSATPRALRAARPSRTAPTSIVHLAGQAFVPESTARDPLATPWTSTPVGTAKLLEAARAVRELAVSAGASGVVCLSSSPRSTARAAPERCRSTRRLAPRRPTPTRRARRPPKRFARRVRALYGLDVARRAGVQPHRAGTGRAFRRRARSRAQLARIAAGGPQRDVRRQPRRAARLPRRARRRGRIRRAARRRPSAAKCITFVAASRSPYARCCAS